MFKFEKNQQGKTPLCIACEEMLTDAVDQTLSPADQAWFDQHVAGCGECSQMVADAQRGAAWLELLKTPRPEPSASLMERILAQTSGLSEINAPRFNPIVVGQPAMLPVSVPPSNVLSFRPRMPRFASWTNSRFEPRLAMTAAMAFFSIALTLNLTGVRLDQLHSSNLKPGQPEADLLRGECRCAVRFYDNLRVVRVMESRVDNLRDANSDSSRGDGRNSPSLESKPAEQTKPASPETKPEPQKKLNGGGMSRRETPFDRPRFLMTEQQIPRGDSHSGGITGTASLKKNREGGLA